MFANDGFKIRGWDETGLHVGSARRFGGSIGTLVTKDADMARKSANRPFKINVACYGSQTKETRKIQFEPPVQVILIFFYPHIMRVSRR